MNSFRLKIYKEGTRVTEILGDLKDRKIISFSSEGRSITKVLITKYIA